VSTVHVWQAVVLVPSREPEFLPVSSAAHLRKEPAGSLIGMPTCHERAAATATKQTVMNKIRRVITMHSPGAHAVRT